MGRYGIEDQIVWLTRQVQRWHEAAGMHEWQQEYSSEWGYDKTQMSVISCQCGTRRDVTLAEFNRTPPKPRYDGY